MRVPSKVLIFVSTFVSTVISLVAGYLLYAESISVLRNAVDATSKATSHSAVIRFNSLLVQPMETTDELRMLLTAPDQLSTLSTGLLQLESFYRAASFASLRSISHGYCSTYFVVKDHDPNSTAPPPWKDPSGASVVSTFYDPVLDHEGNTLKHWRRGRTFLNTTTFEWKRHYFSLDNDTGVYVHDPRPDYEYIIDVDMPAKYEWITNVPPEGRWSPDFFWDSVDGTPYAYKVYQVGYQATVGSQLYHFVFAGYFLFNSWSEVIREFEVADTNLVVFDSGSLRVCAHTLHDGPVVSEDCSSYCFSCTAMFTGTDCMPGLPELGETVSGAVNASLVRPAESFFVSDLGSTSRLVRVRHGRLHADGEPPAYKVEYNTTISLSGGEYFVRRTPVYTAGSSVYELLWLRSVSSVNSEVFAALMQLIVCCVVIFVVDLAIAVCEVVLISRPLHQLAKACQHLKTMDLDATEETVRAVYTPVMVTEVAKVAAGLRYASEGLRGYKAFLPKILFATLGGEESDDDSGNEKSATTGKSTKESSSSDETPRSLTSGLVKAASRLGFGTGDAALKSSNGTIARVQFDSVSYATFPQGFNQIVDEVYELGKAYRGLVHNFSPSDPLCFTVTWNVGVRCPDGVRHALQFCNDICKSQAIKDLTLPTAAISSGMVQAGALGPATHRGFSMTGTPMVHIQAVSAMSQMLGVKHSSAVTLVTPRVVEAAAGVYLFHALTLLRLKGPNTTLLVSQAVSPMYEDPGDWMYQDEEAEKGWRNPLYHSLYRARQGTVMEEGGVSVDMTEDGTTLLEWGAESLRRGKAFYSFGIYAEPKVAEVSGSSDPRT